MRTTLECALQAVHKVLNDFHALRTDDALRMELDALQKKEAESERRRQDLMVEFLRRDVARSYLDVFHILVLDRHDGPVLTPTENLELVLGERLLLDHQTVVSRSIKRASGQEKESDQHDRALVRHRH